MSSKIMINHCIRKTIPFLFAISNKSIEIRMLQASGRFEFSFFRRKEYVITERIKRCMTSEQIMGIITSSGKQLNIVHLTAILDRIEEEGMLNIQQIVDFVVQRLRYTQEELLDKENARALCNIACYLGNIKNTSLNDVFLRADYAKVLQDRNTIEITMLITGLIRLGIFKDIFGIKHEKSKKALLLQNIVTKQFTKNQILSVWYAYICEISKQNEVLNNHLNELLGIIGRDIISLKTYTYAIVCYARAAHTLKNSDSGPLHDIITKQIPKTTKEHLYPFQFSLLLHSINKLKRMKSQLNQKEAKQIAFPSMFQDLLLAQFEIICKQKNVTLRNIANGFKEFIECFGANESLVELAIKQMISILAEELKIAKKTENYELNYKVDLLSFCSLAWKLSQSFDKIRYINKAKVLYSQLTSLIFSYLRMLSQKGAIHKLTNKEILMLFSGLALLKGKAKLEIDQSITKICVELVTNQERSKFSVKEIIFLLTYFKTIKINDQDFCEFVHSSLVKAMDTEQFSQNPKAKSILDKKCAMNLGSKCFNCFKSERKLQQHAHSII